MTDKIKRLHVLLNTRHIGLLEESPDGRHSFTYDPDYQGMPLSLSMPLRPEPWTGTPVEAYIDGVLPDDREQRQRIGRLYGVNPRNPFSLLTAIGLDCAGAVQFLSNEQLKSPALQQGQYVAISEEEIGRRLAAFTQFNAPSWQTTDEHWSLNGAQDKITLAYFPERHQWYEAHGTKATTHILKPGIHRYREHAFNEYLCQLTLGGLGLSTAKASYHIFGDTPAIVSTRWDRQVADGHILRLHQEDMCQAMGVMTAQKYQSDGGPGAVSIVRFMRDNGFDADSVTMFFAALVANFLIGGSDAHAKNYAILEIPGSRPALAPLYDVASTFPYDKPDDKSNRERMAMSIGGQYRFDYIGLHEWRTFARQCGGSDTEQLLLGLLHGFAQRLPDLFDSVQKEQMGIAADSPDETEDSLANKRELVTRLQAEIDQQCGRVLKWFK